MGDSSFFGTCFCQLHAPVGMCLPSSWRSRRSPRSTVSAAGKFKGQATLTRLLLLSSLAGLLAFFRAGLGLFRLLSSSTAREDRFFVIFSSVFSSVLSSVFSSCRLVFLVYTSSSKHSSSIEKGTGRMDTLHSTVHSGESYSGHRGMVLGTTTYRQSTVFYLRKKAYTQKRRTREGTHRRDRE